MQTSTAIALGVTAVAAAGAVALIASGAGEGGDDVERDLEVEVPVDPAHLDASQDDILAVIDLYSISLGLGDEWTMFLQATALGESGLNPLVGRGVKTGAPSNVKIYVDAAEASAAKRAYDRNKKHFVLCQGEPAQFSFGSGGLYALLPANALRAFSQVQLADLCLSPWSVFEPPAATVELIEMLRRLSKYSAFKSLPTFGNFRVGMRAANRMGRPEELQRQRTGHNKLGDRLEQLGYPRDLVDMPAPALPAKNPLGWLEVLSGF